MFLKTVNMTRLLSRKSFAIFCKLKGVDDYLIRLSVHCVCFGEIRTLIVGKA